MPVSTFPRKLEEKLGKEETREFLQWLDEYLKEKGVGREEYREILSRLDMLESSVENLKAEVMEQRREINDLKREMNERFDQMYERMTSLMKWTVGTLALLGSIISIILAIGQFVNP